MTRTHRVVDHIVARLADSGATHLFGVDGANIEDLYDAAHRHGGLTAVLAKHEFSAAAMADGYARATGRPGIVMATSGGGALNLVPGLAESYTSRVPVLALIGQSPAALDGRGSFQDTSGRNGALDAARLFATVSLSCERVLRGTDVGAALSRAMAAADRGGPAVLLLPKDVQQQCIPVRSAAEPAPAPPSNGAAVPIARLLGRAGGPVLIIAGEQVARDGARAELEVLRALLGTRVAVVPDAKDVSGTTGLGDTAVLGVTGVMGHPGVAAAVRASALCLLVGTRLTMTARAGLEDALSGVPTVSLGSAPPYLPCTHFHTADLRHTLGQLTAALGGTGRRAPAPAGGTRAELSPPAHRGPGVRYREAVAVLDAVLPDGVDIAVDAGNTGAAAIHHLPARRSGRFLVALGMGGMGYSFGAGIGMAFGRGRRTVVIAGDGAFFMHGSEIHTAAQYRLPITFALFNNNAHAMCVTREQLYYDGSYSYNRFRPSRLGAGLAALLPGLRSVDVDTADELRTQLAASLRHDGPSVVCIECSADEIPPFGPFLAPTHLTLEETDVAASA